MTRVWENSPEGVSKEMEGKERRVGREGTKERDLAREGKERSIHAATLKKCRGEKKVWRGSGRGWAGGATEGFGCLVGEKRAGTAGAGEL